MKHLYALKDGKDILDAGYLLHLCGWWFYCRVA